MRRKFFKLIMALIAILILINSGKSVLAATNELAGFDKISENEKLILYANQSTGEIALQKKDDQYIWWSNPKDKDNDKIANGAQKMGLYSQITIKCTDTQGKESYFNSKVSVVNRQSLKAQRIDQGIRFDFNFKNENINIPVVYSLGKDFLNVEIISSEITDTKDLKISEISLLPFFGAGGKNESGYIFIPDGSGALINFNNGKTNAKEYSEAIFGGDLNKNLAFSSITKETIKIPVFGIKSEKNAFIAVIDSCEGKGLINAFVGGMTTEYNNVYSTFCYRALSSIKLSDRDFSSKEIAVVEKDVTKAPDYRVKYFILENKQNYSGMAERYRNYLMQEKGLLVQSQSNTMPLYIDIYGGIKKKKSFLGIPYDVTEPLTTYNQCQDITKKLMELGIDHLVIRYTGWTKGGLDNYKPASTETESKLGGTKDFQNLLRFMKNKKLSFYPNINLLDMYKSGNGLSIYNDSIKTMQGAPAYRYIYKLSTFAKDWNIKPWNLLSPLMVDGAAQKLNNSYKEYNWHMLSLSTLGKYNYSDFRDKGVSLADSVGKWESGLKSLHGKIGDLMLESPNAYALPYASKIIEAPIYSSKFDIEDETVPFYQMVLHGIVEYSAPALNLSDNPEDLLLKCIETGSGLNYSWIGTDGTILKDTVYNHLYSANYKDWIDSAAVNYNKLQQALSVIQGKKISEHNKISEGVYKTTYENGVSIIVNYNSKPYTYGNGSVEAKGYKVLREGD